MSQKRKAYTIAEKLHIIDRIKKGETQASISRDTGIRHSTIRGWIKDKDRLRDSSNNLEDFGQARKRARLVKDQQLEEAMMTWFSQARSEGMPISGPVIQTQAKKFHRDIHGEDSTFFASGGWLNRFKQRHGIKQVSIRGEQRSADEEAAESYPGVLRELLLNEGLSSEQVYNCDETGLYYKMLPDKTLAQSRMTRRL